MSSLVLIVPAADVEACRLALDEAGFGPANLSVPMRGTVQVESIEQATHWGSHWWTGEEFEAVVEIVMGVSRDAVIVTDGDKQGYELFDHQGGDYIFVPVNPMLVDGLAMGLGELVTPGKGLPYARTIHHPSGAPDAWPLLQLRSADIVPVSLAADPEPLIEVLTAFVQGGGLTQQELDGIVGAVGAMAGQTIQLQTMIPASWQEHILTREQAEAAGYFGGKSVGLGRMKELPGR